MISDALVENAKQMFVKPSVIRGIKKLDGALQLLDYRLVCRGRSILSHGFSDTTQQFPGFVFMMTRWKCSDESS